MDELLEFLRSKDFQISTITLDGKIHRFPRGGSKDSAWIIGFQNHTIDGGIPYIFARMGDWRTGEEYDFTSKKVKPNKDEKLLIKKKIEQAKVDAEKVREELQEVACERAEKMWTYCKDSGPTAYSRLKQVTVMKGTKRGDKDELLIPMRDIDGKLWGIQRIFPDGKKIFSKGQKVTGTFFLFGEIQDQIVLCEGWATGASVHAATQRTTGCCFNAANLVDVARAVKEKYPTISITIAGDDDRDNEINVGREKAEKAAKITLGPVLFPPKGTDFNDLHVSDGLEAVRAVFDSDPEVEYGYVPLGVNEQICYFYLKQRRDIYKANSFTDVQVYHIAPREHWQSRFESKTGIDMAGVKDHLIQISSEIGPFDISRVRGTGVWFDRGRTVINSGYELIVDGQPTSPTKFKSHYIYIQTSNRFMITDQSPLTRQECTGFKDLAIGLAWRRKTDPLFLLGWLALARVAGALPIRPHIWITGGKGTGKSTVMEHFLAPLLGGPQAKIYVQGGSSESGIRQTLGASSKPIIFDEFETIDNKSKLLVLGMQNLNRQSWSITTGTVIKGSSSGIAVEYQMSHAACMSSIRVWFCNDADKSRYSVIELLKPTMSQDELQIGLSLVNETVGERLFKRAAHMVPVIRASYDVLFREIAAVRGNRVAQQLAMLLAGYYILESDDPISKTLAKETANDAMFIETVDEEEAEEDCFECLRHLLTSKVRLVSGGDSVERTIEEIIADSKLWQWKELRNYGIIFDGDCLQISDSHAELKKIFNNTKWIDWSRSLKRIPDTSKVSSARFGKSFQRATRIPKSILL